MPTALEQYSNLISQAEELERMAGEGNFGGPTYWGDRVESTKLAVSHAGWRRKPDDRFIWALPEESCDAIHGAFDQKQIDELWKAAAVYLRRQAQELKDELKKQADAVIGALTELENHGPK